MLLELISRIVGDLLHSCRNGYLMGKSHFLFFQSILAPSSLNRELGKIRGSL
jgi:hypothetical protein